MSRLTRYEQETVITYNEAEQTANIYTHNKALRRRLEQLAQERPEECRLYRVSHWGEAVEYYVPKSWLKINPTRILTEAQLERNRQAAQKANLARLRVLGKGVQDGLPAEPQDPDGEKEV